jgi:hypothetical protein
MSSQDKLFELIENHIKRATEQFVEVNPRLIDMTIGADLFHRVKQEWCNSLISLMPETLVGS